MKKLSIFSLLLVSQYSLAAPLIMQPEISPDGNSIAFSYQGDIWKVNASGGRADRLTIHEGYESSPKWNADASKIAFSSDRYGNNDVFVMAESGGKPTRLTYHSANDTVLGFQNDHVLFNSRRLYAQVEREPEVLTVSANASATESRFMDALGFDATVSPDGSMIAFVRGTARTSREDYRGPANRNIWIYSVKDKSYKQLTKHEGADISPHWVDNNTLYYLSPKSGKYNVHKITLKGKDKQLTSEKEFGITHFSTTTSGDAIVYQAGDKIVKMTPSNGAYGPVDINVASDFRFDPQIAKKVNNDLDEYAVSPNGKLSAYVVRGDIYVTRNDKEDSRSVRLTQGASRDRDPVWLNDHTLVFASDKTGNNDLYTLTSADLDQPDLFKSLKHLTNAITTTPEDERSPVISPNSEHIAYTLGRGKLVSANISETGEITSPQQLLDGWDTPSGISWSPDSRWLAYSLSDLNFNEEVYIHAADNSSEPVNISMHPKYDRNPVWSPDGSKLGFTSMRNNGDMDIWFVWLTNKDYQRSKEQWRRLAKEDTKSEKKAKKKDKDESSEEKSAEIVVNIDFDGIYKRLEQVTRYAGNELDPLFSEDGETVYFTSGRAGRQNYEAERNLYKIKWDGEDKKTIISGDKEPQGLTLADNGKYIYSLTKGGTLTRVITKSDKVENIKTVSQQKIDRIAEYDQIFEDAWRALDAGFYDPEFHNNDWSKLKAQYKPLALSASTKEDFQAVFNLMLGQLNASHMGLFRGENPKQTQRQRTGLLGIEGQQVDSGFKITSILPNSPADREESQLAVGDIITHINQEAVAEGNIYAHLNGQIDTPVLLTVNQSNTDQITSSDIVIWPTASLNAENYDHWVETRRALTDKYSKGKLGYLHIRGMNWTSFERFERELMAVGHGKEGIVIDVRYNGGGWTTDYLMAVLNVKQHAYTIPRGATDDIEKNHKKFEDFYPYSERLPLSAWTKPSIAMSNETSYSNAEIFSHAYQSLGLGKVVGRPTFGAVISTGAYQLVDGSIVRMPFRGWWVKKTNKNMELGPAIPDIEVFNPPAYKAQGIDPQLERSVKELLKSL